MATSEVETSPQDHVVFAQVGRSYYPLLSAVFVGVVLISNVAATKAIGFGPVVGDWSLITDGAFVLFPLSYVIGDVLSEVYGYRATNRVILLGFAMELLACLVLWTAKILPPADFYPNQEAFPPSSPASPRSWWQDWRDILLDKHLTRSWWCG